MTGTTSPAREVQVTVDCADPRALSLFWCEVLGYQLPPPPPGFDTWDAFSESLPPEWRNSRSACQDPGCVGPRLFFLKGPEGKSAINRLHLDVRAAPGLDGEDRMEALELEAKRLVGLGATKVRTVIETQPMPAGFVVMQDPEGNEFCLD